MAEQKNAARKSNWEAMGNLKSEPSAPLIKYQHLSDYDKYVFFDILKRLLKRPYTLHNNIWHEEEKDGKLFKLIYGRKDCKVSICDSAGQKCLLDTVVATLDIYLFWRRCQNEILTLKNLQTVQNELKFLGLEDEKVHACFTFAKNKFVRKPCNGTLTILSEVIMSFGLGANEIIVMYDDKEGTPVCFNW